ncbi:MAG TPA: hypothetical protein VFE84_02490 [Patescibacteria group bacterium]|nr:hypothetical protein [Patescibacteria group bacterium]
MLGLLGTLTLAALADNSAPPAYPGAEAPLLEVDRFSDTAATLLRRSANKTLPGPNQPIDLDAPVFVVSLEGPGGRRSQCYDLDVRPTAAARLYVFYDEAGNYKLGQFPVVDVAPGDPGYSDLWDVWKVTVPGGFRINSLRDRAAVEKLLTDRTSGYTAARSGVLVNGPIVPDGSKASLKAGGGGRTSLLYLWYRGQRAPYLYFEGSIVSSTDAAPVSEMQVTSETLAPGGGMTATLAAMPGEPGYSPLRRVVRPDGRRILDGTLNCPVVWN